MPAPFSVPDILGALERPVLAVDADGRVANANAAALSMFGPDVATPGAADHVAAFLGQRGFVAGGDFVLAA